MAFKFAFLFASALLVQTISGNVIAVSSHSADIGCNAAAAQAAAAQTAAASAAAANAAAANAAAANAAAANAAAANAAAVNAAANAAAVNAAANAANSAVISSVHSHPSTVTVVDTTPSIIHPVTSIIHPIPHIPISGGSFTVTSSSPITPTGIHVNSENLELSGNLNVIGQLPFLAAVAVDGLLPAGGSASSSYNCGNGNIGITSEHNPVIYSAPAVVETVVSAPVTTVSSSYVPVVSTNTIYETISSPVNVVSYSNGGSSSVSSINNVNSAQIIY